MKTTLILIMVFVAVVHILGVWGYFGTTLPFAAVAPFVVFGCVVSVMAIMSAVLLLAGKVEGAWTGLADLILVVLFFAWDFWASVPTIGGNRILTFTVNIVIPLLLLIPFIWFLQKKKADDTTPE